MHTRMSMISDIRDMVRTYYDEDRGAEAREILGGIHPDNFSGVSDDTVLKIWTAFAVVE